MTTLTVTQGLAALQELAAAGQGDSALVVAFESGRTALGARPATGITAFHAGFDWDHGQVFAQTEQSLGVAGAELAQLRNNYEALGWDLYSARQLLDDASKSADEKLVALKALLTRKASHGL